MKILNVILLVSVQILSRGQGTLFFFFLIKDISQKYFFSISLVCAQKGKLTDWPFEALFVSQGCCPHI